MGVQTVEVSAAIPSNDVEKGTVQWGRNMQRWRNDNIDIAKGSWNTAIFNILSFYFSISLSLSLSPFLSTSLSFWISISIWIEFELELETLSMFSCVILFFLGVQTSVSTKFGEL